MTSRKRRRFDELTVDRAQIELDDDQNERHKKSAGPIRSSKPKREQAFAPTKLRIIAGSMRGRKIQYNGDPAIRPMKERTRESVFNLLGGDLSNTIALDLFGGTGILAMESISRGSVKATVLELSRPAVSTIVENLKLLKLDQQIQVLNVDTLRWLRGFATIMRTWPALPWVVYCCPPYRMWHESTERLTEGIVALYEASPAGSFFVCETEQDFDVRQHIPSIEWDVRPYKPAFIAIGQKPPIEQNESEPIDEN